MNPNLRPHFIDGYLGTERLVSVFPAIEFPFAGNPGAPDVTTRTTLRTYEVEPGRFAPRIAVRNSGAPDIDATYNSGALDTDSAAYLVDETPPQLINSARATFTRLYSRIPPTTYEPVANGLFVRPELHDVKSGGTAHYAYSIDGGRTAHLQLGSARIAVSGGVAGAISAARSTINRAAETIGSWPGDAFTIRGTTGSASPLLSFSADSIRSSIASGAPAILGLEVSKIGDTLKIEWTGGFKSLDCSSSSVKGDVSTNGVTFRLLAPAQTAAESEVLATATRALTTDSAHSGAPGGWLAAWNGDKLVGLVKAIAASGSSVTIPADEAPWNIASLAITHLAFATQAAYRIACGPVDVSARRVRRFYLPGVSAGITNVADIPAQAVVTRDPITWLDTVLSYLATPSEDTYAVDSLGELGPWRGSIVEKSVVEIQMQDAVKQVAVGG